jgi:biopolymer transport protein ExbD
VQLAAESGVGKEINVTPLIDVMLVLIVSFMVIVAVEAKLMLNLPQHETPHTPSQASIVLDLKSDGGYAINGSPVRRAGLEDRLRAIYARRPVKILLVHAAGSRTYGEVIDAMDVARAAGIEVIGYMP